MAVHLSGGEIARVILCSVYYFAILSAFLLLIVCSFAQVSAMDYNVCYKRQQRQDGEVRIGREDKQTKRADDRPAWETNAFSINKLAPMPARLFLFYFFN
jgi:hypothetical protein